MFDRVLERLGLEFERRGVPYMLIGGQAVLLHGDPRLTRDIDVTLGIGPDRLPEILQLVQACGWRILVEFPDRFVSRTMVLPCLDPESNIRIDFIFSFSPYEQEALKRVVRIPIGRAEVCFASIEDLIIHKVIAGRPRDLEDIRSVLLKHPTLDIDYIHHWLGEFDASLNEPFVHQFDEIRKSITGS